MITTSAAATAKEAGALRERGRARFARVEAVARRFLAEQAERVAAASQDMAGRFLRGGRLLVAGRGGAASDAAHVVVEFVHPVIVGKRALPALALEPGLPAALDLFARPEDILLAISAGGEDPWAAEILASAGARGLLTLGLSGAAAGGLTALGVDHPFAVPDDDATVVQEVHETLYHLLWESVHLFLEGAGGSEDGTGGAAARGAASALYPFLDRRAVDSTALRREAEVSALRKGEDLAELRRELWQSQADALLTAARLLAAAAAGRGKVLAFGNGGSATDAQDLVSDLTTPPVSAWTPLPALDLTREVAVVTALGNDVGFASVFSRQVIAFGRPGDALVGFSTSGESRNVIEAMDRGRGLGLRTVGFAGGSGGKMADPGFLDVAIVAPSSYIPRIQEAHATAYHTVLDMAHAILAAEGGR